MQHIYKKIVLAFVTFVALLLVPFVASAAAFLPAVGGTGTTTTPTWDQILIGNTPNGRYDVKTLTAGTNITISTTTGAVIINSTASGGGSFPFSVDSNFGQVVYSTSTPTLWFKSGLFASSTSWFVNLIAGNATTTNATTTSLAITGGASNCNGTSALTTSSTGVVGCTAQPQGTVTAVNGTAKQITSSGGATPTLTLPAFVLFPGDFAVVQSTTTNATTTGSAYFTGVTASRPLYVDSTGKLGPAGSGVSGNCVNWGANNTLGDTGAACGTSSGGITQINTTYPILGGPITTTGTISTDLSTTTFNIWSLYNKFTYGLFATLASSTNATTTGSQYFTGVGTLGGLNIDSTGKVYSSATTTAGTGLSYNGTSFTVNTSQNIATLSNLTSNGFVYTAGGNGTLNIAASSSIFGYIPLNPTRSLTVSGTANQISISGGTQDLSADRTWTATLPSLVIFPGQASSTQFSTGTLYVGLTATSTINGVGDLLVVGSTTLQNFTARNSTTTNATTTSLAITGGASNCNGTSALTTTSTGVVNCTAQPQGTLTSLSVATANGFAGSSGGGATPIITITTSVTAAVLKGNGTAISGAVNGTDYTLITANTCGAGQFFNSATAAGVLGCATPSGSGGAFDPFDHLSHWGQTTSATTSALWLEGTPFSLFASSTAVFTTASTTGLTIFGQAANSGNNCLQIDTTGFITKTGSACGGAGSSPGGNANDVQYNQSGTTFAGSDNFVFNGTNVGAGGTTTPWSVFSIIGANSVTTPAFAIATSSTGPTLFGIVSTSSPDYSSQLHVTIGTTTDPTGSTLPLYLNGEYDSSYRVEPCHNVQSMGAFTADGFGDCPDWSFDENGNGATSAYNNLTFDSGDTQYVDLWCGLTAAITALCTTSSSGTIKTSDSTNVYFVGNASSTMTMQAIVAAQSDNTTATTTRFFVGFLNASQNSSWSNSDASYGTGCSVKGYGFIATSTGTWVAWACDTGGNGLFVDTGVAATSTGTTGQFSWKKMRVTVYPTSALHFTAAFYINDVLKARIPFVTTGAPSNVNAAVSTAGYGAQGGLARHIYVADFNFWQQLVPVIK